MSVLELPELDAKPWPTLGPLVCDWIEANLVFGPGDLRGQPAKLDDEKRALVYRMYELHPKGSAQAGRRRFRRVCISLRKGTAKSEFAAWLAAAELHPDAPVRCVGFDRKGSPIGGPVQDPYIPLMAYTEDQSEELVYGALKALLEESPIAEDFDIAKDSIVRSDGTGKAVALAGAPGARDGARTTFQVFDETHRYILPRLKEAHRTMLANLPKRKLADPWALETTTAYAPGEQSVAEATMAYAEAVKAGKKEDAKLFFFHRQASETIKIYKGDGAVNEKNLRKAILEASGPAAPWTDITGIAEQWDDPEADRSFLERVWLNRPTQASDRAFDVLLWKACARPGYQIPDGALITLGFDGSRYDDATALVACEVETGHLATLGIWERPHEPGPWEVPEPLVLEAVGAAFGRWRVWRMYADPPYWETTIALLAKEHGEEVVVRWRTNQWTKMSDALRAFATAMKAKQLTHDDNEDLTRHVGNAHKQLLRSLDSDRKPQWVITKERKDSPKKIDGAMAATLANEARRDALTEGAEGAFKSVYETREPYGPEASGVPTAAERAEWTPQQARDHLDQVLRDQEANDPWS